MELGRHQNIARWFLSVAGFVWLGGFCGPPAQAQPNAAPPRVLIVIAHPDDEYFFAATVYRIATELGGSVDEVILTSGEGGYRYSALGEAYYGQPVQPRISEIRKLEAAAGAKVLGIREQYFLDQADPGFTTDPEPSLNGWDIARIETELDGLLNRGSFDAVMLHLPRSNRHGQHQAASLLALRAVERMPRDRRPLLVAADVNRSPFRPPPGEAAVFPSRPRFVFHRTEHFGYQDALSYHMVVNWMIAEHKSQGQYQNLMGTSDHEYFWVPEQDAARADALFAIIGVARASRLSTRDYLIGGAFLALAVVVLGGFALRRHSCGPVG